MPTAISFANNKMKIIRGKFKKHEIFIDNYMTVDLPENVISDGIIKDDTTLFNILSDLKKSKKIDKECFITIHSGQILSKVMDLPFMKPQKIKVAARREFENLDDGNEEYIFDYSVLESRSSDGNHGRVLFSAMPWFMLESYIDLFDSADLSLTSCDMFLNCVIKYIGLIPELQSIPYILAFSENNILTSFLFAEGKYLFSNRSPLLSEPGTDEYAGEIAGKFSAIKQFYKAEKYSAALEHAFIFGLSDKDADQSRTLIGYLGIQLDMIPESSSVKINTQNTGEPFIAGNYLATIGCLMRK